MADQPEQDITTQILIQIRDETRSMRSDFEKRFDGVEVRLENLENRMVSLDRGLMGLDGRMDALETRMDSFEGRMESLEARMAANREQHNQLLERLEQIDSDLKKFVGLVNETILLYAEEMDTVRDRLDKLEDKMGISVPSD
jgi:chromosome segregation ATPase